MGIIEAANRGSESDTGEQHRERKRGSLAVLSKDYCKQRGLRSDVALQKAAKRGKMAADRSD